MGSWRARGRVRGRARGLVGLWAHGKGAAIQTNPCLPTLPQHLPACQFVRVQHCRPWLQSRLGRAAKLQVFQSSAKQVFQTSKVAKLQPLPLHCTFSKCQTARPVGLWGPVGPWRWAMVTIAEQSTKSRARPCVLDSCGKWIAPACIYVGALARGPS